MRASAGINWKVAKFFTYLGVKLRHMKLRKLPILILSFALLVFADGCSSGKNHKHKKLKPGKPIPCPQKDC